MKRKLKVRTLQKALNIERKKGKTIGFVPTMGALHSGHMSLISAAKKQSDIVVCSIFVNPTQFNEASDLAKYPRTLAADSAMLAKEGCHFLFFPPIEEIYPNDKNAKIKLDLKGLDRVMEGEFRPGHFDGVVQVVHRLLTIVAPDFLFMGQKDFQQFTIIQHMIDTLEMPVGLVVCPIKRERSGLAMSSRNRRLLPHIKKRAGIIYKTLVEGKKLISKFTPSELRQWAKKNMTLEDFEPEYVSIINGHTLRPLRSFRNTNYVVMCTAVWAGNVRLIDNMILRKDS